MYMIVTILIFLLILSVLVVAHEFGHYIVARKAGVKVEEFGWGFPPRLTYFTDKRGTKWSINLIPLGGFVKLKEEEGGGTDPDGFAAQSKLKRAAILVAGVVMNVLVAMVLYSIVTLFGAPTIVEGDVPRFAQVVKEQMLILEVAPGTAAASAELPMGSELISINGVLAQNEADTRTQLATLAAANESATLTVKINEEEKSYTVSPQKHEGEEQAYYGFYFAETKYIRYPFPVNIWIGIRTGFEYLGLIIMAFAGLLWSLISGGGVQEAVSGPVGIAKMTGQVAQLGIIPLLQFAAILSLNLAVLNIMPFPALDGGRLFFLAIEAIRRKPVSEQFEGRVHQIGFLILMILVILVTYRDIANLF
jgi:regulator of sigma E protease